MRSAKKEASPIDAPFHVGERFTRELHFDAASIVQFAKLVGDDNPIHHDDAVAGKSRFGKLIASGTHISALMMGATASYVTERGPSLGLETSCRFRRGVTAGSTLRLEWEITAIEPKQSLDGSILTFIGKLVAENGEIAATGMAKTLVPWRS
jgi:acyl dehydratase